MWAILGWFRDAADTDFGEILVLSRASHPSLMLFRVFNNTPANVARLVSSHLSDIGEDLKGGAIVVFDDVGIRIHRLA